METPSVNRHQLYVISRLLYNNRDGPENYISHKTSEFFDIQVELNEKKATCMTRKRVVPASRKEERVYFMRTSEKDIDEVTFLETYNTILVIEASFSFLKIDLEIHPNFNKTGENSMAHLFLVLLAYQLVNTIRQRLRQKGYTSTGRTSLGL